jgi:hypothetical protein
VGGLDGDVDEPGFFEQLAVLRVRERPCDASDPGASLGSFFGGEGVVGDDVGDPDAAAGLEDSGDL